MTTINQKLKMTPEEYELLLFGVYARWCESVTINDREFQKVIANSGINKWFMTEYAKCEAEFVQLTQRYEECDTITAIDFKKCYHECTYRMFSIRPMVLLQIIKKSEVLTPSRIFNLN
jgi:hypothetical protein